MSLCRKDECSCPSATSVEDSEESVLDLMLPMVLLLSAA